MAANDEVMNGLINGVDFKLRRIYFGVPIDWTEESAGDFTQASVEIATPRFVLSSMRTTPEFSGYESTVFP